MVKVAQCWDDGVETDIQLIEILKKYNAKATFNLNPGTMEDNTVKRHWVSRDYKGWSHYGFHGGKIGKKDLREIYAGFLVASHGLLHKNAGMVPDAEFMEDAAGAKKFLEDLFETECPGYAWPCGRYTQKTADLMLDAGFKYGRTVMNTDNVENYTHPMILSSSCHFLANDFYSKFEAAKARNGVFYFWGHSYEMLDSEGLLKQLEEKIRFITEDPETEWINVVDIVDSQKNNAK